MKAFAQWTKGTPEDSVEIDSADWSRLASAPMHALDVQGVLFDGADHYSIEDVDRSTTRVVCWADDTAQWPVGQRWAREVTFRHLAPDAAMGNAINTNQTQVLYADSAVIAAAKRFHAGSDRTTVLPWADFDPRRVAPQDGLQVTDAQHEAHIAARTKHSWREWTEGLDPSELDAGGLLKSQRAQGRYLRPDGTVTYFINNPTRTGVHTIASGNARSLDLVQGTAQVMFGGNLGINSDALYAQHTTIATEPGFAQWGTGTYRAQIEVAAAGAGLTFGYTTAGASVGHFGRINAAASADIETKQQVEALGSGTGIHLFTTGSVSWGAGAVGDRFEILLACARDGVGHGNQSMDMNQGDADAFADGPFDGAAAVEDRTVFFGANF